MIASNVRRLALPTLAFLGLAACSEVGTGRAPERAEPYVVTGELAYVDLELIAQQPSLGLSQLTGRVAPVVGVPASDLQLKLLDRDPSGALHARYTQRRNGLEVVGADLTAHTDALGTVTSLFGNAVDLPLSLGRGNVTALQAEAAARRLAGSEALTLTPPELVYAVVNGTGTMHLAWRTTVEGAKDGEPVLEDWFIDAHTGERIQRLTRIHTALNRVIHTANNTQTLPGTQLFAEGGTSADAAAMAAYTNSGKTYDFYKTVFNRDSYNNAGALLRSSVHVGTNFNNAFWNGQQMAYGDGDGTQFTNFASDLDVVAHELTHAVTSSTADLQYQNESGALNESFSDILGVASGAANWTPTAATWLLGEGCYTPGTAGDALRYMDNPTRDGVSRDYYPERFTGTQDNGGVHINSGIQNLAFKLLVTGGKHPRMKTNIEVPALGLEKATRIFYRSLTTYLGQQSNFAAGRTGAASAGMDLYGIGGKRAVEFAFAAVGVGDVPPPLCSAADAICDPGCNPIDPDCYCAADGQCTAQCTDLSKDPDCPKDCVKNDVCAVEACPVPDPDCVAIGQTCASDLQCKDRRCVNDTQRKQFYCSKSCTATSECPAGMECEGSVCRFPKQPELGLGEVCVPAENRCAKDAVCTGPEGEDSKCQKACTTADECSQGSRCETGTGGIRFCREVIRQALTGEDSGFQACSSSNGSPAPWLAVLMAISVGAYRTRRRKLAVESAR